MGKLFGTDGIRGKAGIFPLDTKTIAVIGSSFGRILKERLGRNALIVTGRDTRESGSAIEAAFHNGAKLSGARCLSAGVITTPGVAYLTSTHSMDAGVVISASHNPFEDNGIKIFMPDGKKIDDSIEQLIENDIEDATQFDITDAAVDDSRAARFAEDYLDHLRSAVGKIDLSGMTLVLDCAHGASSKLAPRLFQDLGAKVIAANTEPDGRNINFNCGSLHLEGLQAAVLENNADAGIAFDGDADRSLFVDENGNIIDGDATLWILAQYLKSHGKLANSTVVATVMSNIGLELALSSVGIKLLRANVGDKYVLEMLLSTGSEVGGEQSGHIIFPEMSLVGDGMMTALLLLHAVNERKATMSSAVDGFVKYPQILVNVRVGQKLPFDSVPTIAAAAQELERDLDGNGRLLLRYSGTENLARVMIEGKDQTRIEQQAHRLADVIRKSLN